MSDNIQYINPCEYTSGIYKIVAPGGYYYYGSTNNFKRRLQEHCSKLLNNTHYNRHLQCRFNKCMKNWIFEVVERVDTPLLESVEQTYLDKHYGNQLCMNVNPCSERIMFTEEIRANFSMCRKRDGIKPPTRKGSSWTKETRDKITVTKKKINYKPSINFSMKGKKHTNETRLKMSLARKAYYASKTLCTVSNTS